MYTQKKEDDLEIHTFRFYKFPIFIELSKKKPDTGTKKKIWSKINSQYLYNGKWSVFDRMKVVDMLHNYYYYTIINDRPKFIKGTEMKLLLTFAVPKNYGSYTCNNGILKENKLHSNWDLDNATYIFIKTFNDYLVKFNYIDNDTISGINNICIEYKETETIQDRYLKFELYVTSSK